MLLTSPFPQASVSGQSDTTTSQLRSAVGPGECPGAGAVHRRTFTVPPTEAAVPEARHDVNEALQEWGVFLEADRAYAVELIVTELVTNSVLHAGSVTPRIAVTVEADASRGLSLGVGDNHPARPTGRHAVSAEETSGRGLGIIEILVDELGGNIDTRPDGDRGKSIWVHLPAPAQSVEDAA